MAKKPESRLQRKIREELEERIGGRWMKIHGGMYQEAGISDFVACVFGFFVAIEVKTDEDRRGGASSLQKQFIQDIIDNGGCAFVTYSPKAAVRKLIKWLLNEAPASPAHRRRIREAIEDAALQLSARDSERRAKEGRVRIVDGAGHWEDHHSAKGRRRAVAKKFSTKGFSGRPKKRPWRVATAD